MADPREFVLIGRFDDGITPELVKINNQLAALKRSFTNIGGKGARTAARDLGKFNAAVEGLNNTLKVQNQVLRSTIEPMRQYRREVGKTVGALKKLDEVGGRAISIERTNKALKEQIRLMDQLRGRQGFPGRGMPGTPSRRYTPSPIGPAMPPPPGGGRRGVSGGGFDMAEFGFAFTLGQAVAQPIQNAIVTGFQIGVGLMTRPFEYFANAFGERVQDELSDLKAAGGLYAISKRSQNPFLKDIDEAIQFQQDTNKVFAKMAGALPGVTNDYVQVGKRLSDTAARIVNTDFQGALQEANRIRSTEEGRKFYGGTITGTGAEQQREVITTLLGELTKKTTIAGLGGPSRAGGIAGAYGLPGLTERMLSQEQVSIGQFQRYAAVFSDPTIADALQRNIANINATQLNSIERFKAIQKLLDEVVTPELIEKLRTSVDGIYQGFRSTILDPDTGLFGLGRNFQKFGKRLNQYGQYVDEAGKVVDQIDDAAAVDLSLFEIIRDILSNLGQALLPIAETLPLIFDPLKNIASTLMDARHYAAEFNRTFNQYREGLKALSEQEGMDFLKDTLDVRASLAAINNLLAEFGVIGDTDFQKYASLITSKDLNIGQVLSEMIDSLLDSDIAKKIGETIGSVVGTVLSEVAGVTGFLSGRVAKSNQLFAGLQKGFQEAGGVEAFRNIFRDVFGMMIKGIIEVFKALPMEAYAMAAAALVLPAAVQGLAMKFATRFLDVLGILQNLILKRVESTLKPTGLPKSKPIPGLSYGMGAPGKAAQVAKKGLPVRIIAMGKKTLTSARSTLAGGIPGVFSKGLKGLGKAGGIATLAVGLVEALMSLFKGDSLGTALGKGAGPVLGTIIGTALLGPLGGIIGGLIGSLDSITEPLGAAFDSVLNTLGTVFDFLGQVGGDLLGILNGFVRMLPGVGEDFDVLRFAITALLSPFRLLELGVLGIYEAYLRLKEMIPGLGLSEDEKKKKNEIFLQRMERTAALEIDFRQAYNKEARAAYQKELDGLRARGQGEEERARIVENAIRLIDERLKKLDPKYKVPPAPTTTTTPSGATQRVGYLTKNGVKGWQGTDGTWTPLAQGPTVPGTVSKPPSTLSPMNQAFADVSQGAWQTVTTKPKEDPVWDALTGAWKVLTTPVKQPTTPQAYRPGERLDKDIVNFFTDDSPKTTAQETTNLNKKATDQLKKTGETTLAIKDLTTKITAQTSIQTTVAAIYNLLASGSLRVNGTTTNTPGAVVYRQEDPYNPNLGIPDLKNNGWWWNNVDIPAPDKKVSLTYPSTTLGDTQVASLYPPAAGTASGGGTFGDINVTVNAGSVSDPDEIATLVAYKLGEAVADARSASIFV